MVPQTRTHGASTAAASSPARSPRASPPPAAQASPRRPQRHPGTYWPNRLAAGGEVPAPADGATPVQYGFGTRQNAMAVQAGPVFRPIGDSARDTLAWLATVPEDERAKATSSGLKPDKEAGVLAAWKART